MFFLALFLGFAKRRGEMHRMGEDEEPFRRPVLAKYRKSFLDMQLAMTATMSILCYALYTVTRYPGNASLVVTVPLVTYGVTRYMLLVMVDGHGEAPEKLLVSDRLLVAHRGALAGALRGDPLHEDQHLRGVRRVGRWSCVRADDR